jgi:hypothetical protein
MYIYIFNNVIVLNFTDFTGVIAKINPFFIILWKFLRTLMLKKYPFSIKILYEHAAP